MQGRLSGKTGIVVGATSGIGESIARLFSEQGARVALVGRRRDKGEQIAKDIRDNGGSAFFAQADVLDSKSIEEMVRACVEKLGGTLSILVYNAGIATGNAAMEYVAEEDWDKVMDTNAKGAFLTSKAAVPHLVKGGGGSIIMVSSAGGLKGYAGGTAYASSKAAMIMLTRVLALEHGKENIRTNCVCPGSVRTEMFESGLRNFARTGQGGPTFEQLVQKVAKGVPLGRIGEPRDVANLALFLSSDEASFVNGAVVVIDGGQSL